MEDCKSRPGCGSWGSRISRSQYDLFGKLAIVFSFVLGKLPMLFFVQGCKPSDQGRDRAIKWFAAGDVHEEQILPMVAAEDIYVQLVQKDVAWGRNDLLLRQLHKLVIDDHLLQLAHLVLRQQSFEHLSMAALFFFKMKVTIAPQKNAFLIHKIHGFEMQQKGVVCSGGVEDIVLSH